MPSALYLQNILTKASSDKNQKILAVSDEGRLAITINYLDYTIYLHEIGDTGITSTKINVNIDVYLPFSYTDEDQSILITNSVKIDTRDTSKVLIYLVTNEKDKIAKVVLKNPISKSQPEISYHEFDKKILDIALHPTHNNLVMLFETHLYFLQNNLEVPLNLSGSTYVRDFIQRKLIVTEKNGVVSYYAFFKVHIQDTDFGEEVYEIKVKKVHEKVYKSNYVSGQQLNLPASKRSFFNRIGYDLENGVIGIITELNEKYQNIFMTQDLKKLPISYSSSNDVFQFFSKQPNTMFTIKDYCQDCSKSIGCYHKYSVQNEIIIIQQPEKCYSEPFKYKWQFYGLLGEVTIRIQDKEELYLYSSDYIFNTNVQDKDIANEDNPHLYYENKYFSEPSLKFHPNQYSFKYPNHLIFLDQGNLQVYKFKKTQNDFNILSFTTVFGIILGILLLFLLFFVIRKIVRKRRQSKETEEQIKGFRKIAKDLSSASEQQIREQAKGQNCSICHKPESDCYLACNHFFHENCLRKELKDKQKVCPMYHPEVQLN